MSNRTLNETTRKYAILQDAAYRKNIENDQGFDVFKNIDQYGSGFAFFDTEVFSEDDLTVKYRDGSPDGTLVISDDRVHIYNPDTGFSHYRDSLLNALNKIVTTVTSNSLTHSATSHNQYRKFSSLFPA